MWHLGQQPIDPIIKIMVADGRCVILQFAHQLELQFAPIKIEIRCSLENIPGIKEQGVRIFVAYLFHQSGPFGNSAQIGELGMGSRKWIYVAVHVVGVQNRDVLLTQTGTRVHPQSPQAYKGRGCCGVR